MVGLGFSGAGGWLVGGLGVRSGTGAWCTSALKGLLRPLSLVLRPDRGCRGLWMRRSKA